MLSRVASLCASLAWQLHPEHSMAAIVIDNVEHHFYDRIGHVGLAVRASSLHMGLVP